MMSNDTSSQGGSRSRNGMLKLRRKLKKGMFDVDIVGCEVASVKDSRGEGS